MFNNVMQSSLLHSIFSSPQKETLNPPIKLSLSVSLSGLFFSTTALLICSCAFLSITSKYVLISFRIDSFPTYSEFFLLFLYVHLEIIFPILAFPKHHWVKKQTKTKEINCWCTPIFYLIWIVRECFGGTCPQVRHSLRLLPVGFLYSVCLGDVKQTNQKLPYVAL